MENVLIVDDDTDLLMILKRSLFKYGYLVTTLSEPARVQQTIDDSNPGIVIMDVNMGDYDGRNICKHLRSLPAYNNIPIIIYSAMVDGSAALEACKADLFLAKPLTSEALAGHLSRLKLQYDSLDQLLDRDL